MNLNGKVALVTGASRGIGAATAALLARRGAAVAVNYVKNEAAATTASFGPIDIAILNAGAEVPFKPFINLTFDDFERKVVGELKGFFHPLQEILPGMIARKSGCIIGISSGLSRHPGYGFSAHTTVKSAVDGLMKSLALELGPLGIRVNTVAPGLTLTDATAWLPKERITAMAAATPMRRVATPEDVAGAILTLVSDDAGFVTGAYLPVSGGVQMM